MKFFFEAQGVYSDADDIDSATVEIDAALNDRFTEVRITNIMEDVQDEEEVS